MPKNLFSIDYCASHPGTTNDECTAAFKQLGEKELKGYTALSAKRRREAKKDKK